MRQVIKTALISMMAGGLGIIAYVSPAIAGALTVVGISAFALRRLSEPGTLPKPTPSTVIDNPTTFTESGSALDQARTELGIPASGDASPIDLRSPVGHLRLAAGHRQQTPFVSVQWFTGEETEMTYVLRRKHSLLGLARVVDNTPVHGSQIEYRLRTMELPTPLDQHYNAGTSRPRLFRELLAAELGDQLADGLYDAQYRLEELSFTGRSLTITFVPAASPATGPWANDVLGRALKLQHTMQTFLSTSTIPSAQS